MANGRIYPYRRRSLSGPIVLICLGILFLLANIGVFSRARLWWWFATYWPLLLIISGIIRLIEYTLARRSGGPVPRFGGGAIFLLLLLIFIGLGASESRNINWQAFNDNVDIDTDFNSIFNQKYEFTDQQEQELDRAAKSIQIESEYGNVKIHPLDAREIKINIHRRVAADTQEEANKLNAQNKPAISLDGNTLRIQSARPEPSVHIGIYMGPRVMTDLEIWAPKDMPVNLSGSHGDVELDNRIGDVTLSTTHGDIQVSMVKGNVAVITHHGSVQAHNITGDVSVNGRLNDTDLGQITGSVTLDGDFFGETKLAKIDKSVHFSSSRTEMQLARLDGDLEMDSGDLRGSSLAGPFLLRTRSKDVRLENVSGDITIENSNAEVELHPASPAGNVDIRNRRGAIHMIVPPNSGFSIDARSDHGDIESDFDLPRENVGHEISVTGNIGKGGPTVHLTTDHGVIEIRRS